MSSKTLVIAGIIVVVVVAAAAVAMLNNDDSKDVTEGVIYDGNGGTTSSGKSTMGLTSHEVMSNPFTKEGAHFESWNTKKDGSGTKYAPGDSIDYATGKTVTLYAIWNEGKSLYVSSMSSYKDFTLTYDGKELAFMSAVDLPAGGEVTITVKSNNTGGQMAVEGSHVEYKIINGDKVKTYGRTFTISGDTGHSFVPSNGDVLIKITYDGSKDVTLSFSENQTTFNKGINYSGNGGKTSEGSGSFTEDSTTVSANKFTLEGKTFAGWNTARDGSGTAYKAGDSVEYYGCLVLYAQWA